MQDETSPVNDEQSYHAAPQRGTNLHFDLVIFWLGRIKRGNF